MSIFTLTRRRAMTGAAATPVAAGALPVAAAETDALSTPRDAYVAWRDVEARLNVLHKALEASLPSEPGFGQPAAERAEFKALEAEVRATIGILEAEEEWHDALDAAADAMVRAGGDTPARVFDMVECVLNSREWRT